MRVLMARKFFRPVGGAEVYFRELAAIVEANGHQTIPFAVKHPDNPPTPYERCFLEELDYRDMSPMDRGRNGMRILSRTLYSREARCKIEALIHDTQPDIAHLQAIDHHISPSILEKRGSASLPCGPKSISFTHACLLVRACTKG